METDRGQISRYNLGRAIDVVVTKREEEEAQDDLLTRVNRDGRRKIFRSGAGSMLKNSVFGPAAAYVVGATSYGIKKGRESGRKLFGSDTYKNLKKGCGNTFQKFKKKMDECIKLED